MAPVAENIGDGTKPLNLQGNPVQVNGGTLQAALSGAYAPRLSPFLRTGAIAETYPRAAGGSNQGVLSTGRLTLVGIDLLAGTLVTSITFCAATTALVAGTNQWFGLFDSARAKLGLTVDDTSTAWAANAEKTLALSTPFTTTYSGIHYLGINVTAATVPTLAAAAAVAQVPPRAPAVAGNCDSGLTNPASCPATAAAFAAVTGTPWAYCS